MDKGAQATVQKVTESRDATSHTHNHGSMILYVSFYVKSCVVNGPPWCPFRHVYFVYSEGCGSNQMWSMWTACLKAEGICLCIYPVYEKNMCSPVSGTGKCLSSAFNLYRLGSQLFQEALAQTLEGKRPEEPLSGAVKMGTGGWWWVGRRAPHDLAASAVLAPADSSPLIGCAPAVIARIADRVPHPARGRVRHWLRAACLFTCGASRAAASEPGDRPPPPPPWCPRSLW